MWGYLPTPVDGVRKDNVLFATWYDGLAPMEGDATPSAKEFDALLALREQVAKVLEPMRAGGEIGAALEAEIALKCGVSDQNWLAPLVDELRFLLIRSEEHTSELQSLMRISYAVFCLKKKKIK